MSDFGFIGALDLTHGGDFSAFGLRKERGEELFLFWQGEMLVPPASLARRVRRPSCLRRRSAVS